MKRFCMSREPEGRWYCSLERDHEGDHRAHADHDLRTIVLARWKQPQWLKSDEPLTIRILEQP